MTDYKPLVLINGVPTTLVSPDKIDSAVLPASTGASETFAFFMGMS